MDSRSAGGRAEQAAGAAVSPEWDAEALAELERLSGPRCSDCGEPLRFFETQFHFECGVLQVELPLEA